MKFIRKALLLGLIGPCLNASAQEELWICQGEPLTLECPTDSVVWLFQNQGEISVVDSALGGITLTANAITLTDSLLGAGVDVIGAQSTAASDSGTWVCSWTISPLVLPEAPEPFVQEIEELDLCFGDSVLVEWELPSLPDPGLSWSIEGHVESELGVMSFEPLTDTSGWVLVHGETILDIQFQVAEVGCDVLHGMLELQGQGPLQAALVTSSETELCFSNQGVEFTLEQEAQGGQVDSIQWEMFDGGVWSPMDSAVIADPFPEGVNEFRFVSFTQCGIATSDVIEVVVYPEVNAPQIALLSSDTLCNENTGAQIQIAVPASGGFPSNDATWSLTSIQEQQQLLSNGEATLDLESLQETTQFQLQNVNACGVTSSNTVEVAVFEAFSAGEVLDNVSSINGVCHNDTIDEFHWSAAPEGGSGNYSILWSATNAQGDVLLEQDTSSTFEFVNQGAGVTTIQLVVEDDFGCGTAFSQVAVEVYEPVSPPTVAMLTADTLCNENTGVQIQIVVPASGGFPSNDAAWSLNSIQGQQQLLSNGEATLDLESLQETTQFQLQNVNACGVTSSNTVEVVVFEVFSAGEVLDNVSSLNGVCHNDAIDEFYWSAAPEGGSGNYSILWSATNAQGDVLLEQDTSSTFEFVNQGAGITTIQLIVEDDFGCGTTFSQVAVEVYEPVSPPTVAMLTADTLCYSNNGVHFQILNPSAGGHPTDVSIWNVLSDGSTEAFEGTTTAPFILPYTPSSIQVQLLNENVCGDTESEVFNVHVFPQFQGGTVLDNASSLTGICHQTLAEQFSWSNEPEGGSTQYDVTWHAETLSGEILEIQESGGTFSLDDPQNESFEVSLTVSDAFGCGSVSSSVEVEVFEPLQAPQILLFGNDSLCAENIGIEVAIEASPSGGAPDDESVWVLSTENNQDTLASDGVSPFALPVLAQSATLQLLNVNACGNTQSGLVSVEVLPAFMPPSVLSNASVLEGVCFAEEALPFEWSFEPSGGSGSFTAMWEAISESNVVFASSLGEGVFELPTPVEESFAVHLLVADDFGCGQLSSQVEVEVFDELVPPHVSSASADTSCFVNDGIQAILVPATGGKPDNELSWVWLFDGENQQMQSVTGESLFELELLENDLTLWATNFNQCGVTVSDTLEFAVLPEMLAPSIVTDTSLFPLCYGSPTAAIEMDQLPAGATNVWSYDWILQEGENESVLAQDEGAIVIEYMTASATVRLEAESSFGCGVVTSNGIFVEILDEFLPGVLSESQLLCHLEEPAILQSTPFSGGSGDVDFIWSFQQGQELSEVITNSDSYQLGPLTDSLVVLLEVYDNYGCGSVMTNSIALDVLPALEAPSIVPSTTDTLCYESGLTLNAEAFTFYPWLDIEWSAVGAFSGQLQTPTDVTTNVASIGETSTYTASITSDFGCGTVVSEPLVVPVYLPLESGSIAPTASIDGTFCFGDTLPIVASDMDVSGGSGNWTIEWIVLDQNFEIIATYPGNGPLTGLALSESILIERKVEDELGCGSGVSNVLSAAVFDEITWQQTPQELELCFGEDLEELSALALGGGDQFEYTWSADTQGPDLNLVSDPNLSGIVPQQSFSVSVEASSLLGCGSVFSDTVSVTVALPMLPGAIEAEALEICAQEDMTFEVVELPVGGFGQFELQWWQQSVDGSFVATEEGNGESYTATADSINMHVFLEAQNECGTVTTDSIEVQVNPLPSQPSLIGDVSPCLSSTNQGYVISSGWWLGLSYEWTVEGGEISSGESGPEILVDWEGEDTGWSLEVLLTDTATLCQQEFVFDVAPTEDLAPAPSEVVKKLGLDVLVSGDSSECANHQWGRMAIASGDVEFLGENLQYLVLEDLSPDIYHYFVDVSYSCEGYGDCITRNFYLHDPFVNLDDIEKERFSVHPVPTHSTVTVQGAVVGERWVLRSFTGRELAHGILHSDLQVSLEGIPSGVYLLSVASKTAKVVKAR